MIYIVITTMYIIKTPNKPEKYKYDEFITDINNPQKTLN